MGLRLFPTLLTVMILVAGCAEAQPSATSTPTVEADSDVGDLEVVVTTSELLPVDQALVEVAGTDLRGSTDAEGRLTFAGIQPQAYTVSAAKPGFRALHVKGRVADVIAGERTEIKLVLDPIGIIAAEDSYHRTLIFRGFISCSVEHSSPTGVRNRSQCGNGVDVAGTRVGRDPNDNFSHPWQVETAHIRSLVLEAKWASSFSTLGDQLYITAMDAFTCNANSCNYSNEIGGKGGPSPLHHIIHEGEDKRISSKLERNTGDDKKYPQPAWTVMRTFCPAPCTAVVTLQQSYEAYTTAFYGEAAPDGWSTFGAV